MNRALLVLVSAGALVACIGRPGLDDVDPDPATLGQGMPKGFLMGTATAAHQIEGNNSNDWTDWEDGGFPDGRPHIHNNDQSGLADDSYNRVDEDIALMQSIHAKSYRFSVEWSRIQPTETGGFVQSEMDHYVAQVDKLRAVGIEPMVTLFHFTLPKWVAAKGGFENPEVGDDFEAFTRYVAQHLGGKVDLWCTINEPNVYVTQGYLAGVWPPGLEGANVRMATTLANLFKAHGKAAAALREVDTVDVDGDGKATLISVAHHVRVFQPATSAPLEGFIAGLTDDFFNESTPRAVVTGRISLHQPLTFDIEEQVPGLEGSVDFIGVNYYTRYYIRADLSQAAMSQQYYGPGRPTNDLGWELYPDGLYQTLIRFKSYGLPIYITENGMPDEVGDKRSRFMMQHLDAVRRAVRDGADVRAYYYWSLLDNFEWAEGFSGRFGLFKVDYENNLTRTATPAAETFRIFTDNIPN